MKSGEWRVESEKGFSLIELIFVIFIIAILASISVPNFITARDKARIAAAKDNLNTILKGINMYYAEYGYYPMETTMDNVSSIPVLQEELVNPDNYLQQFYDNMIIKYKVPSVDDGGVSPFEIFVRTNAGANKDGKYCWLYYSDNMDLVEVWSQ